MTQKEQLTAAQTRITELESTVTKLEEQLETSTQSLVTANAERAELEVQVGNQAHAIEQKDETIKQLHVEKDQLSKDLETEKGKVADLEKKDRNADERAREIAARNGANLPPKDPNAGNSLVGKDGAKTLMRSAFDALKPSERQAFMRQGGKLVDDNSQPSTLN